MPGSRRPRSCQAVLARLSLAAAAGLALAGCTNALNERNRLANAVDLPALAEAQPPATPGGWSGPGPRTATLVRGGWEVTPFLVPVDGVVHGQTWRSEIRVSGGPRRKGLYPTPESAIDLQEDPNPVVLAALTEHPVALADVFLLPLRAVTVERPGVDRASPSLLWKRTDGRSAHPGPLPKPDAPEGVGAAGEPEPETGGTP